MEAREPVARVLMLPIEHGVTSHDYKTLHGDYHPRKKN